MNFFHKIPIFIFSVLCPCKIHGKENIPEGKTVIVSNHFHACDCGFLSRVYGKDVYFLAKKEVFKKKLFGSILKSYGGLPIDRDNPDMKSLLAPLKVLKNGHKLVVFPEGTRNKTGTNELQPIKPGAVVFAVKAKAPIVPVMILNKMRFMRRTPIIVGEPFELKEFYDKKLTDEDYVVMSDIVKGKMLEQHQKLKDLVCKKKNKRKKK